MHKTEGILKKKKHLCHEVREEIPVRTDCGNIFDFSRAMETPLNEKSQTEKQSSGFESNHTRYLNSKSSLLFFPSNFSKFLNAKNLKIEFFQFNSTLRVAIKFAAGLRSQIGMSLDGVKQQHRFTAVSISSTISAAERFSMPWPPCPVPAQLLLPPCPLSPLLWGPLVSQMFPGHHFILGCRHGLFSDRRNYRGNHFYRPSWRFQPWLVFILPCAVRRKKTAWGS